MTTINPYRPSGVVVADKIDTRECVSDLLHRGSEVPFAGTLVDEDLEEFLSLSSGSSAAPLMLIPIVFGCLAVLVNASWPWIMSAVGLALLFLVMVSLLSRSYRRSDFLAFNTNWDLPVQGRLFADGYEYRCGAIRARVTWEGVSNSFANEQLVAFQSAVEANVYRVIPRRFVASDHEWALLQNICQAVHCDEKQMGTAAERAIRARKKIMQSERAIVATSPDAIDYSGPLCGSDIRQQRVADRLRRTYRRYIFYAGIALVGVSAIIGGLAGLIFRGVTMDINPSVALLTTAGVVFVTFGVWVWFGARRRASQDYTLFHQSGFLTDQTLHFDTGVYALEFDWAGLQVTSREADRLSLWEPHSECAVTLSRLMFESEDTWQAAVEIIEKRTARTKI